MLMFLEFSRVDLCLRYIIPGDKESNGIMNAEDVVMGALILFAIYAHKVLL